MTTSNPRPPAPSTLIVHGLPCPRFGQVGDEYHIHYTGALCGRHFNQIVVQDFGYIPQDKWVDLLGWLPTRLRRGGAVTLKWSGL